MIVDDETVLDAIAAGLSVRQAAKRFDLDEGHVRRILKIAIDRCEDGDYIREAWMLEERRLTAIGLRFYQRAMEEGDAQAAVVFLKASERRATLRGANAPSWHTMHVVRSTTPVEETSTDKIERVLAELMITDRSEKPH